MTNTVIYEREKDHGRKLLAERKSVINHAVELHANFFLSFAIPY